MSKTRQLVRRLSGRSDTQPETGEPAPSSGGGDGGGVPGSPADNGDGVGDVRVLDPPEVGKEKGFVGTVADLYRLRSHYKKRRTLIKEGYVQWYLIDDSFPSPRFVKPSADGDGVPTFEYDGGEYMFNREALLASEKQGMWTAFHRKGEAEPIDLRSPRDGVMGAEELNEYLTLAVTKEPPSWLDALDFDMDPQTFIKYIIGGFIAVVLLKEVLGL